MLTGNGSRAITATLYRREPELEPGRKRAAEGETSGGMERRDGLSQGLVQPQTTNRQRAGGQFGRERKPQASETS